MAFKYSLLKITTNEFTTMPTINIIYGSTDSKFGKCVMGLNEDHFCFLHFGDFDTGFRELRKAFPNSTFLLDNSVVEKKLQFLEPSAKGDIKLLLKGTEFEMRVWEHLVHVPRRNLLSYEDVAKGIGHPKAVRAVANAIAKNKIAYFVPCHRVISKNGHLNKFKWGADLKRQLLLHEKEIAKRWFIDLFSVKQKKKLNDPKLKEISEETKTD